MKTTITARAGYFTSSSIYKLMSSDKTGKAFGKPALTYIEEKRLEVKLGRQLQQEKNPRSASWGNFCEKIVFEKLSTSYIKNPKGNRKYHPTLHWSGEEDFHNGDAVGDFKCFELKNFCQTHDAATSGWESLKEECEDIAWQLVSHAILCNKSKAELILFVPYLSELELIIQEAKEMDNKKYNWIAYTEDENEFPYLLPDMYYKNLTSFVFDLPEEDIKALTDRVILANKMLIH